MGWLPQEARQRNCVLRQWCRLKNMDNNRLNNKIYRWSESNMDRTKNWTYRLKKHLNEINCAYIWNENNLNTRSVILTCEQAYLRLYTDKWKAELNRERARRGNGQNKLRTYRTFKSTYETETYVKIIMPFSWRSAFAKFRAGVAPLRLETGRLENLAVNQRTCFKCSDLAESEKHVLLSCPLYDDLQQEMYYAISQYKPNFRMLNDDKKIAYMFSSNNVIKAVA